MDSSLNVSVLFFAKAGEVVGSSKANLPIPNSNLRREELLRALEEAFPELKHLKRSFILALNEEYIEESDNVLQLKSSDELAVIPPISGG